MDTRLAQLARSLASVRSRIDAAARSAGRSGSDVTLVVVTKARPIEDLQHIYELGVREFGENRASQLEARVDELPADIRWHFIGSLQSRSVPLVASNADVLHSLDRDKLIGRWSRASTAPAYVQVNVSGEQAKHGYPPAEAVAAVVTAGEAGIVVAGLMTMAPYGSDAATVGQIFRDLARLRDEAVAVVPSATGLSMGMSDDFEVAVTEGATVVRIGRAIFGGEPQ